MWKSWSDDLQKKKLEGFHTNYSMQINVIYSLGTINVVGSVSKSSRNRTNVYFSLDIFKQHSKLMNQGRSYAAKQTFKRTPITVVLYYC